MFQSQGAPMTQGRFIGRDAEGVAIVATALGTMGGSASFHFKEELQWRRTVRGTATRESAASLKPRRWVKSTGRNAVARPANLWIRRKPESSNPFVAKRLADSLHDAACDHFHYARTALQRVRSPPVLLARQLSVLRFVGRDHRICRE